MALLRRPKGRYEGPICFVAFDHAGPDGKQLEGGWHYSTKIAKFGPRFGKKTRHEIPDQKLHLNDSDPANPYYEFAQSDHRSWVEKHGVGNIVELRGE